jgi:hypothetical protein
VWRVGRRELLVGAAGVLAGASVLARQSEASPDAWRKLHALPHKLGAFVGGAQEGRAQEMETWLGRSLDFVQDYGDGDVLNNTFRFGEWPNHRKLALSQPLSAGGWDLAEAAAGRYDNVYARCVHNLKFVRERLISLRIGWEMNGDWMPWSAGGKGKNQTPESYIGAFRRFARIVHAELPGVPIDWCPNFDKPSEQFYPGDAYVDIIGCDVYLNKQWIPNRWSTVLDLPSGLRWLERFARLHQKPISFPEWATNYDDGSFVRNMYDWMRSRPVVYQAYWNDDNAFPGRFKRYPSVERAYLAAFGGKPG